VYIINILRRYSGEIRWDTLSRAEISNSNVRCFVSCTWTPSTFRFKNSPPVANSSLIDKVARSLSISKRMESANSDKPLILRYISEDVAEIVAV